MTSLVTPLLTLALPAPFVGSPTARLLRVVLTQLHAVPTWLVFLAFAAGVAFIIWRWRR
jgi:hypothetical protein